MERTISDEEKIRRAIEISQRRNRTYVEQRTAKVNVNNKKNYNLFKRMILQILICLLIYCIFYLITTTNYIFSEDVIKQTSSILNYDINFQELYQKCVNQVKGFIGKGQEQNDTGNETENQSIVENQEESNNITTEQKEETSMTQMEQDAIKAKELCDFELPLKGTISSEFRRKRSNFADNDSRP